MLPCVCSVIDHRRRQNVVRTSVTRSAIASCATFFVLTHFELNRRTATRNLFANLNTPKNETLLSLSENRNVFKGNYLKFSPPSAIVYNSPSFSPETKFFKWLTSNTCHSSSSVYLLNGSRFSRRFPENNTGSCWENFMIL